MKKRILSVMLALVMIIGMLPMTASAVDNLTATIDTGAKVTIKDTDGDGYYEIGTADQLYAFAALVNGGETAINGELVADIVVNTGVVVDGELSGDASGFRLWNPIGAESQSYVGTFEGNNHTIKGLYAKTNAHVMGFFRYIGKDGKLQNLGICDSFFAATTTVGAFAGNSKGVIANCYNINCVLKNQATGGIVGSNDGTVTNCYNMSDIKAGGKDKVGGIAGANYGAITNCYNTGNVKGMLYVGGIAGDNKTSSRVTNCYNTGNIDGATCVGGVVGLNEKTVADCYNTGIVSGRADVGGVVGRNAKKDSVIVKNCYNTGTVDGELGGGGVAGENGGSVTNCYYLRGTASVGIYEDLKEGLAEEKTEEAFSSGDVAILLSQGDPDSIWGQNIDRGAKQAAPLLGGRNIYKTETCQGETMYSNSPAKIHKGYYCTVEGYERCRACGEYAHRGDLVLYQEPPCAADGYAIYKCWYCDENYLQVISSLGGHKYTFTCTDTSHVGKCENCDYILTGFHDYADSCTCICGTLSPERRYHNLSSVYIDATCTEDSHILYYCADCDATFTDPGQIEKYGHTGGEATCSDPAICDRCGESYGEIGTHKGGEATCSKQAICKYCGEGYGDMLEHSPDDDYDCTTNDLCLECGTLVTAGVANHEFDEEHYCTHEDCYKTEGCIFTFIDGDAQTESEVHYYDSYYFNALPDKDGDGVADYTGVDLPNYIYVDGAKTFRAVYGDVYLIRYYRIGLDSGEYEISNIQNYPENGVLSLDYDYSYWYTPLGWATEPYGEKVYDYGEEITVTKTLDLYTVYEPFIVTFDLDGGTWLDENGKPVPESITESTDFYTEPTKPGYTFKHFVGYDQYGSEMTESFYTDEETGEKSMSIFVNGKITYTAVWEECTEHSFDESGACSCGMIDAKAIGSSLALEGSIDISYYFEMSEKIYNNPDAIVRFTFEDGRAPLEIRARDGAIDTTSVQGKKLYVYDCDVFAKQMTDKVTAQVILGSGKSEVYEHSVSAYAKTLIEMGTYPSECVALVKAMVNYGAYAQAHFGYHAERLANEILPEAERNTASSVDVSVFDAFAPVGTNGAAGAFIGVDLILESETTLNVYFVPSEGAEALVFAVDGKAITPKRTTVGGIDCYMITIGNIAAQNLDKAYEIAASDGTETSTYSVSALSYCYSVMKQPTNGVYTEALRNAIKALYLYNDAANTYFENK